MSNFQKIAEITAELDQMSEELQAVDPVVALALDRASDMLEGRKEALFGLGGPKKDFPVKVLRQKKFNIRNVGEATLTLTRDISTSDELLKAAEDVDNTIGDFRSKRNRFELYFSPVSDRDTLGKLTGIVKKSGKINSWGDEFKRNEPSGHPLHVSYQVKSAQDAADIITGIKTGIRDEKLKITIQKLDLSLEYADVSVSDLDPVTKKKYGEEPNGTVLIEIKKA